MSTSPKGTINGTDWYKSIRGAGINFGAGLAIMLLVAVQASLQSCVQGVCDVDFGFFQILLPAAISGLGMVVELVRRFQAGHTQ